MIFVNSKLQTLKNVNNFMKCDSDKHFVLVLIRDLFYYKGLAVLYDVFGDRIFVFLHVLLLNT